VPGNSFQPLTLAGSLLIRPGFAESLKTSDWKYQEKSERKTLLTEFGRRLKGAVEFAIGFANPAAPQFSRMPLSILCGHRLFFHSCQAIIQA
jgi:hypothetical protein